LLTSVAWLKATCGEEEFVFNAQGGLTVKSFDLCNKRLISTVNWQAVACAAKD